MPQTDEQYLHEQEKLDRIDAIRERRELLMDEFHDSLLSRVTMQRLRNAHDEGRKLTFRSECVQRSGTWLGMICIAQSPAGGRPLEIYRDLNPERFRRMKVEIEEFYERLKR